MMLTPKTIAAIKRAFNRVSDRRIAANIHAQTFYLDNAGELALDVPAGEFASDAEAALWVLLKNHCAGLIECAEREMRVRGEQRDGT